MKEILSSIFNKEGRASLLQFLLGALSAPLVVILFFTPEQQHALMEETQKIAEAIETIIGSSKAIGAIVLPVLSLWLARLAGASPAVKNLLDRFFKQNPDAVVITDKATAEQIKSPNVIATEDVKAVAVSPDVAAASPSDKVVSAEKVEVKQ